MTAQPSVLQVVILRDGLLVGTEVFVPGSFTVGSAAQAEVRLEDPSVDPLHAVLFFQNGRAAIQDNSSRGGVYVNGHRVRACELRSQDELILGPFVLKTRIVSRQATDRPAPSAELAALLGGPAPSAPAAPAPRGGPVSRAVLADATVPDARVRVSPPQATPVVGTVPSARRAAALAAAPHLRPVPLEADPPTEAVELPVELFSQVAPTARQVGPPRPLELAATDPGLSPPPPQSASRLYLELFWGEVRRDARSFGPLEPKRPVVAAHSERAAMPLWGFELPKKKFVLAQSEGAAYRVFVPPGTVVERQGAGADAFFPLPARELEADGDRRFLTLTEGMAARLSQGEMSLVAYVGPPAEPLRFSRLSNVPWVVVVNVFLLCGALAGLVLFGPKPKDTADFKPQTLPQVAVRLLMPEPEKKAKAQKKLAELKEKAEKSKPAKKAAAAKKEPRPSAPVKGPASESKALKALARLSAGPASTDVLAAIDKASPGGGSKKSKDSFKLSGLVGSGPVANSGLGSLGLGGGKGGSNTKGLEMLNGRGGSNIGALGAGGFGKGSKVGGTVAQASSRRVSARGNIDKDAVAKVINSHLQEIRGCYERALLKDPGLAGKTVLEWTVSTSGAVTTVKTKSSTLRNGEVEGCILRAIKGWRFPPARGGSVIVSYPFVFNSVGY